MTNKYQQAAIRAGDWFLNTQVKDEVDANRGRYLYCRHFDSNTFQRSSGWQTAFGIMAVLSLHKLTGEKKYLDSAALAVEWLKSLQILDQRDPTLYGAFREETQLFNWSHPRDAVSSAWGLLCYAQYVGDEDCMERAKIFADWMIKYAFKGDWPKCTVNLGPGGLPNNDLLGSFQSGGILFFHDLYDASQEERYKQTAKRMSDFYADNFFNEQGELTVFLESTPEIDAQWPQAWRDMHRVNDDFGSIALVRSYEVFQCEKYRKRLDAFMHWTFSIEKPGGGFLNPEMEVGSATVPIALDRYLSLVSPKDKPLCELVMMRCLDHLLTFQQTSDDKQIDGAFLGLDIQCKSGHGRWVNIRCTAYAILALLLQSGHSVFPFKRDALS